MNVQWNYTEQGAYPEVYGKYEHTHYPQIPCLVEYHGDCRILVWNATEGCWDSEDADDYFCMKDEVTRWMYLDAIMELK